jgi:hypothetical protein
MLLSGVNAKKFEHINPAVLKLGVVTFLKVANFQNKVVKLIN